MRDKFHDNEISSQQELIKFIPLDLKNTDLRNAVIKNISNNQVDLCINIAGKNILKSFYEWDEESLKDVFDINFIYTTLFIKEVAVKFIEYNTPGKIILISSQHGIVANKERIPYCVSKGMLAQLTRALALELAPYSIRVNSVSPTFVKTKDNKKLLETPLMYYEAHDQIPLKKYAEASDVASAICFLANDENNMITGHDLVVDGGWTIHSIGVKIYEQKIFKI